MLFNGMRVRIELVDSDWYVMVATLRLDGPDVWCSSPLTRDEMDVEARRIIGGSFPSELARLARETVAVRAYLRGDRHLGKVYMTDRAVSCIFPAL
jgi:hypothetical protein